jgi:hypothetical protein
VHGTPFFVAVEAFDCVKPWPENVDIPEAIGDKRSCRAGGV